MGNRVIDAWRTYQLADNYTLGSIDYKGASLCHQRKVSHENFMFVDLVIFFVYQSYSNFQRCRISYISFFALLNGIFRIIHAQSKVDKFQAEFSAVICDRRNVIKDFFQPFVKKPLVGILLDFNQVGHFQDFFLPLVTHSHAFSSFYRTNSVFFH